MAGKVTKSIQVRFWEKVDKNGPFSKNCGSNCYRWTASLFKSGYGQFGAKVNGKNRKFVAHRVSWEMAYGEIPVGMQVLHKCDNRWCVRKEHLFLGTQKDNIDDMIAKGRKNTLHDFKKGHVLSVGSKHGKSRLTEQKVVGMRRDWASGKFTKGEIARKYNISPPVVTTVLNETAWKHV